MLDLDHFKQLNDTHGHAAGDTLLRAFGALLRTTSRESDIGCRYGGDEFILVLPDASVAAGIVAAERVRQAVKDLELEDFGRPPGGVTVSVGIAGYPDHGTDARSLVQMADAALYQAKAAGRDRVTVARPS